MGHRCNENCTTSKARFSGILDEVRYFLWIGLAACYSPAFAPGSPCDPAKNNCPVGQFCVAQGGGHVCATSETPIDATAMPDQMTMMPDGSPNDLDGDGVLNADDNCPTKPNANQANEDGDAFGDVCDPCPPFSDNSDSDGDGVGDLCDPNPNAVGDKIMLFEGFSAGIPGSWLNTTGWTASNGDAKIVSSDGAVAYLGPTLVPAARSTVSIGFLPEALFGTGGHGFGVTNPATSMTGAAGYVCEMLTGPAQETQGGIVNLATGAPVMAMAMTWAVGDEMMLGFERANDTYGCLVIDGGSSATTMTNTSPTVTQPAIAIRSRSVSGRAHWFMYVTSP